MENVNIFAVFLLPFHNWGVAVQICKEEFYFPWPVGWLAGRLAGWPC